MKWNLLVFDLKISGVITFLLNDKFSARVTQARVCLQQYLSNVLLVTYFIVLYINVLSLIQLHKLEINKDFFGVGWGGDLYWSLIS